MEKTEKAMPPDSGIESTNQNDQVTNKETVSPEDIAVNSNDAVNESSKTPKNKKNYLKRFCEKMLEVEDKNLEKSKENLLRKEEEFYEKSVAARSKPVEQSIADYKEQLKERKKEKKKWLYRIGAFTPIKTSFFHTVTRTTEHIAIEEWWFSLPVSKRKLMRDQMKCTGLKKLIISHVLEYAESEVYVENNVAASDEENNKPAFKSMFRLQFYKYWFVYCLFIVLIAALAINFRVQSPFIALFGMLICAFILFFSRVLKIRRSMGLKIFCPVTIGWLRGQYTKHNPTETEGDV